MSGFRRYAVILIAAILGYYEFFVEAPISPEEWAPMVKGAGAVLAAALNLWSALKPAPAAGTV